MRALLIVNPRATTLTGPDVREVVRELGSRFELRTEQTRYRGHARELGARAATDGDDLVVAFGGDGTINEIVNGLMTAPEEMTGQADGGVARPAIAAIPGGAGNVFARALGVPVHPTAAARRIVAAAGRARRTIGLGLADDRYFTFSVGFGLDAEVIADVERQRASGRQASQLVYMRTALRRFYAADRSKPPLTLHLPGQPSVPGLFFGVVTNGSPWTYLGGHPVRPAPHTDFNSGLDVFALRRLRTLSTLSALHQMIHDNSRPPSGRDVLSAAALAGLTFSADRPTAFHIDGDYLGQAERIAFKFVPNALCVIA